MTTETDIASALSSAQLIDPTFPVAGQDNNSQGFRDNFEYTQTSLTTVTTVLSDLNNNTAKTNNDNDFNGVIIENAEVRNVYGSVQSNGSSLQPIDFSLAQYHRFTLTASSTLTLTGWPASDLYAKVIVELKTNGTAHTVNFTPGTKILESGVSFPFTLSADPDVYHVFEIWSHNGGDNIFIKHVGEFS